MIYFAVEIALDHCLSKVYTIAFDCNACLVLSIIKKPFGWTNWGRVTDICVIKLCQDIIWTNAEMLLIGPWGTDFNDIYIKIQESSLMKMHLKMSSGKWPPFRLGLDVLRCLDIRYLTSHRINQQFLSQFINVCCVTWLGIAFLQRR